MKKINLLISLILICSVLTPMPVMAADDNGVDDLRGRWDVEWDLEDKGVILYINDWRPSTVIEDRYYAGGCMRSLDTDEFMPLSMRADYQLETHSYNVVIYGTAVLQEIGPFVVRFDGNVPVYGNGVPDDFMEGVFVSEQGEGGWTAEHHDRRRTICPSVGGGDFGVQADVYAHKDLGYTTPRYYTLYETHTVVVSSGMLVEAPDGSTMVVKEYTDIFSPDVDFVGRFRYLSHFEGTPNVGGTYKFVLLDVFGDPIPGTESTDVWNSCPQGAPEDLTISTEDNRDILLEWASVEEVSGQFEPDPDSQDPESNIGFYQIGVSPFNWEGDKNYGANGIQSPSHTMPWGIFEPGQPGTPDGWDYGWALSALDDGLYQVQAEAFSQPHPVSGGLGHECAVYNSAEQLVMYKEGDTVEFEKIATISGKVTDTENTPLSGIDVGACDYIEDEDVFCSGNRTDANGFYTIILPTGRYRVGAFPETEYLHEFFEETQDWNDATDVNTPATEINFTLTAAGSISGTVEDEYGQPIQGLSVDACEYDNQEYCASSKTDINGYYSILVPADDYWVQVWPEEGYVGQVYDVEEPYGEPDRVQVDVGEDEIVNFRLREAGMISGRVISEDDMPLPGLWVDACEYDNQEYCASSETDGDGYYSILVPAGDYWVQIMPEEGWIGQVYDVDPLDGTPDRVSIAVGGIREINFTLEPYVEPPSQYLNVQPIQGWADSGGWMEGDSITLSFEGFSDTLKANTDGNVWFNLSGTDIGPDVDVTVTDGNNSKVLNVVAASFDGVEVCTAWGTAPPNMNLGVAVVDNSGFHWIDGIQADGDSKWSIVFPDCTEGFNSVSDAWVHVFDEDGDSTLAHLDIP